MTNPAIVLGSGCFWCTEAVFSMIKGIVGTTVGYSGGSKPNPSYEEVCAGNTGHIEVCKVEYDPKIISLETILEIYFKVHDPTSMDRQGNDIGEQYRSVVFYANEEQKKAVESFIKRKQSEYTKPIVTMVKKLDKFYPAEEYHQKYYEKNPYAGYCSFVISPKVAKVEKEFKADLKS